MELEEVTPASQSEKLPPGEQQAMWHGLFGASFGEATSATKKGPWNELETGTQCCTLGAANKKNRVPCCMYLGVVALETFLQATYCTTVGSGCISSRCPRWHRRRCF